MESPSKQPNVSSAARCSHCWWSGLGNPGRDILDEAQVEKGELNGIEKDR